MEVEIDFNKMIEIASHMTDDFDILSSEHKEMIAGKQPDALTKEHLEWILRGRAKWKLKQAAILIIELDNIYSK